LWTAADRISVWTYRSYYGLNEHVNLMLSLILLTIIYVNHIFPIYLLSFMTINLVKSIVSLFCMFLSVYCLFVRLLFIFLLATRNGVSRY